MKREYKIVTRCRDKLDEDICGTFLTVLCLITSKIWGNFEVIKLDRLDFYE